MDYRRSFLVSFKFMKKSSGKFLFNNFKKYVAFL